MNRSLLIFSILLILLGLGSGLYLISIFGVLLLFPALLSTPRPRPQGTPTGSGQQAREPAPVIETAAEPAQVMETTPQSGKLFQVGTVPTPIAQRTVPPVSMPSPMPSPVPSQPSFSAPLFPTSIFPISVVPSASQQIPSAQAVKEARSEAPSSRDEVLELGALLALIKLAFG